MPELRGAYVDTRRGRLHYREAGEGPVVVLLHGLFADSTFWLLLAALLAERFRVLAPDIPPAGLSEAPPREPESLADYTDVVVAWLDAIGVERFSLGGWHFGASIAVDLAGSQPDRVERLVPIGLLALTSAADRRAFADRFAPGALIHLTDADVADPEHVVRQFVDSEQRPRDPARFSQVLVSRLLLRGRDLWLMRAVWKEDVTAAARAVRAPTRLVYLTGDVFVPEEADRAARLIHGAELVWLDGAPSLVVGDARPLADTMIDFLPHP